MSVVWLVLPSVSFQNSKMIEMGDTMKTMKQVAVKYEGERREMDELRSAHTAQNQLLQRLQEKVCISKSDNSEYAARCHTISINYNHPSICLFCPESAEIGSSQATLCDQ